jgi:excisionase family DNA binding protein
MQHMETTPQFLRVKDVAKMLDLSVSQVYVLMRSGELPSIEIAPRTLRVDPVALQAWIDARRRGEPTKEGACER